MALTPSIQMSSSPIRALLLLPILVVQASRKHGSPRAPSPTPLGRMMTEVTEVEQKVPEPEITLLEELKLMRDVIRKKESDFIDMEYADHGELIRLGAQIASLEKNGVMEEKTQCPLPEKPTKRILPKNKDQAKIVRQLSEEEYELYQKITHEDISSRLRKHFFKAMKEEMYISEYNLLTVLNDGRFRGLMDTERTLFFKEIKEGLPTQDFTYWCTSNLTNKEGAKTGNYINHLLDALDKNCEQNWLTKFKLDRKKRTQKITETMDAAQRTRDEIEDHSSPKYIDCTRELLTCRRQLIFLNSEDLKFSNELPKRHRWSNLTMQMDNYMKDLPDFTPEEIKKGELIDYKILSALEATLAELKEQRDTILHLNPSDPTIDEEIKALKKKIRDAKLYDSPDDVKYPSEEASDSASWKSEPSWTPESQVKAWDP